MRFPGVESAALHVEGIRMPDSAPECVRLPRRGLGTLRILAVPAAAGVLAASLAMMFWPPLSCTYQIWILESCEDETLAIAEGLDLDPPAGSDAGVRSIQAAKKRLLDSGSSAAKGLIEALDSSCGKPDRIHHARAYAHLLCAIGDRRAAPVVARVGDGDPYIEAFLLDCGFKGAAAGLIAALDPGPARGFRPPARNAAGPDVDSRILAAGALERNFKTGFGPDPEKWKLWWRENYSRLAYDSMSLKYMLRSPDPVN